MWLKNWIFHKSLSCNNYCIIKYSCDSTILKTKLRYLIARTICIFINTFGMYLLIHLTGQTNAVVTKQIKFRPSLLRDTTSMVKGRVLRCGNINVLQSIFSQLETAFGAELLFLANPNQHLHNCIRQVEDL